MSEKHVVPDSCSTARTATRPTWTSVRRVFRSERPARGGHANRVVVAREPELPPRTDDGPELFNRSL